MSSSRAKAQTAIEVLFIAGLVLIGAAIILPGYMDSNTDTVVLMHVKNAADNACSYLGTGVAVEDPEHSSLNTLIEGVNYSSISCRVSRVFVASSTKDSISLNVTVIYSGPLDVGKVENAISGFIESWLESKGFSRVNGALSYGGKTVSVTVKVVRR
ncbi:hypothetical protein X802_06525 [Thermococcus guaymasensis DSM 11113]|uniref:Class III signal peptide-containing protein n=1 Tax=Thermococcus guaymasensis DSM 11113 TaxID=1432656 RepID=A0A0X1KKQ4_9EURY|nr:hypothetical protein [Thermococcus guaymasensis]AJC71853.1 hypothetical protein X802_06525 [Thermococcus guaymasensis DSM 11113]